MTLDPSVPLRMLSQYCHVEFPERGTMEEQREAIRLLLENCKLTVDMGTQQMGEIRDPDLLEDVCQMRAAALEAIKPAEAALAANSLEKFNVAAGEFRSRYVNLVRTVKNFLWDAGPLSKRHLWPLVEEVM
jgi:hypothetical protein